jgi:hypothetical protein
MAQTDWTTIPTTYNNYFTSISGTAIQHSTITNPITSAGTWFRNFRSTNDNNNACAALIPANSALLTSSLGYPYGYTYSMRAWVRNESTFTAASWRTYTSLAFKSNSTLAAQHFGDGIVGGDSPRGKGYYLVLRPGSSQNNSRLDLQCSSDSSITTFNTSLAPADNNSAYRATVLSSFPDGNWLRVRMDVMSLPSSDLITVFSGSQVEGSWTQIHQVEINRLKTGAYVPWYNNPSYPSDNTGAATSGHMGTLHFTNMSFTLSRIDQIEVFRQIVTL